MAKKLMICPFCDMDRAFTYQGLTMHIRAKHPDKLSEFKDNKDMYMTKFACDELGNPTEAPEPTPEPTPAPKETPDPVKTKEPPAPEVTPPTPKEKPAEGGGFLDTLKKAIDGLPG